MPARPIVFHFLLHPRRLNAAMSALGQKRTCAAQKPCPLGANSGHSEVSVEMSAKCQKRASASVVLLGFDVRRFDNRPPLLDLCFLERA